MSFAGSYDGDDIIIKGMPDNTETDINQSNFITYTESSTRRRLDVAVNDILIDISAGGGIGDGKNISAYSSNLSATEYSVWYYGSVYTFPSSAATLSVVSTSTNDTSAGTGARTLYLEGLDSNYSVISETVTMNGTTNVTTTNSYLRFNYAAVLTAGSLVHNVGVISFTNSGTIIGAISPTNNFSLQSNFTVPASKNAILLKGSASLESGKSATVKFKIRPFGQVFQDRLVLEIAGGGFELILPTSTPFAEKTDMILNAKLNTGTAAMGAFYSMILVDA